MNEETVEKLFDIINEACVFLYEHKKSKYLDSLVISTNYLTRGNLEFDLSTSEEKAFKKILNQANSLNINTEIARKAMEFLILRGFKEQGIKNGNMTPETICLLVSYLAQKIFKNKYNLRILDGVVGTANLLTAVANQFSDKDIKLFGIDSNELMTKIAKENANMQDYDALITLGNTLEMSFSNIDLVLGDLENVMYDDKYFPHEYVKTHFNSLNDMGYMILVIPNDFFLREKFTIDKMQMIGLIELPNMGVKKSILIIQKSENKPKEFLLVKLPSFDDVNSMNECITKIEQWFIRREMK